MRDYSLLTGRKTTEFLLFTAAFVGFLLGGGGIIVSSAPLAFLGTALCLLALVGFLRQPPDGR